VTHRYILIDWNFRKQERKKVILNEPKKKLEPSLPSVLKYKKHNQREVERKLTTNTPSVAIWIWIIRYEKRTLSFNCSTFFHIEVSNSKWFKLMAQKIKKIVIEKHFAQDHVLHLELAKAFTHKHSDCQTVNKFQKPFIVFPKGHVCARKRRSLFFLHKTKGGHWMWNILLMLIKHDSFLLFRVTWKDQLVIGAIISFCLKKGRKTNEAKDEIVFAAFKGRNVWNRKNVKLGGLRF
jgi:hypothetical protein